MFEGTFGAKNIGLTLFDVTLGAKGLEEFFGYFFFWKNVGFELDGAFDLFGPRGKVYRMFLRFDDFTNRCPKKLMYWFNTGSLLIFNCFSSWIEYRYPSSSSSLVEYIFIPLNCEPICEQLVMKKSISKKRCRLLRAINWIIIIR